MNFKLVGLGAVSLIGLATLMGSCTIIDSGSVGVKTTFGQIDRNEVNAGFTLKAPFVTSINHYNIKEATIDIKDLTPKAKDNLSLKDLDVSIFYQVNSAQVADLIFDYAGQTSYDDNNQIFLPGHGLVYRYTREAIYDAVSKVDSLTIHQKREYLSSEIKRNLQLKLDKAAKGAFKVNNIAIRSVLTDPSIEQSIQLAVKAQKELEQKQVQTEIAKKDAEIKVTEARGIADSNKIINSSLTREYLQHESNKALMEFAKRGSNTVVVPANMETAPLINVK